MLSTYRRHTKACTAKRPQHDRAFWKCKCVIYAEGSIGGEYIRQSLKTRSREQANRRILEAEARASWDAKTQPITRSRTIAEVIAAFLEDAASAKGRELAGATLSKYRTLLRRLERFCGAYLITKYWPQWLQEKFTGWTLATKSIATALVIAELVLVGLSGRGGGGPSAWLRAPSPWSEKVSRRPRPRLCRICKLRPVRVPRCVS